MGVSADRTNWFSVKIAAMASGAIMKYFILLKNNRNMVFVFVFIFFHFTPWRDSIFNVLISAINVPWAIEGQKWRVQREKT